MNEAKLRKLIAIFKDSGVEEMEYSESFWRGTRLRLNRARTPEREPHQAAPSAEFHASASPGQPSPPAASVETDAPSVPDTTDEDLHLVLSPMVGTFYHAPSPDAEPFVSEGESIAAGRTLCVIEAMKIMNEIEAEISGVVVEMLVANGEPVEYNQPLLKLRPA